MKILVTTIIDNVNYGTYLQAFATCKLLSDLGHEPTLLNYIRPHLNSRIQIKESINSSIPNGLRKTLSVFIQSYYRRNLKKFLHGKVELTKEFTNWTTQKDKLQTFDLYLTGSDQVWNTKHNHGIDPVFYFEGISGPKIAFSASVGMDSFPEDQYREIKNLLSKYKAISVRESYGVETLSKLGLSNISQVLDPTLILNKNSWQSFICHKFQKTEPYLLVYSVEVTKDNVVLDVARKIAKERNLKIYMVSAYKKFNSRIKVDRVFSMASVNLFLALFANADYAVVSSFHGTAFAINFNCQFITIAPENFNTRVMSLLNLLGLNDRYVTNAATLPDKDINYLTINEKLEFERNHSNSILEEILGNTIEK